MVATAWTRGLVGSDKETGAEEHIQEARRAPCSGGKAGAEERCQAYWDAGDCLGCPSELKRELKEIKRAWQQLGVARAEDRQDAASGDTLYAAVILALQKESTTHPQRRRHQRALVLAPLVSRALLSC